jgi:DMSO reductase family type II enzyme heme b subunit
MRERWPAMADDGFPEIVGDLLDQSLTARAVGNSQSLPARPSEAEDLSAQGLGTVAARAAAASSWIARGQWKDGYWDVVFRRPIESPGSGEPALFPGLSGFVAFAVWDGALGDRNGQKSVSVWHRLELAP